MAHFYPGLRFALVAICGLYLPAAQAATFSGKVVSIADGDTLTVLTASKQQHRIRLAEIDAPEKHQPFGTKSKQSLSDLCFGKEAEVFPRVKTGDQRIVARVKCAGVDANAEQVNRGMAWVYRRYAKDHDLYVLEHGAKVGKRGLWADSSPTPPWQWRKNSNVRQV
jgi:endonuclease YncB( thermonuclease family)